MNIFRVGKRLRVKDVTKPRLVLLADCFLGKTFFLRRETALTLGGFLQPDYGNDYELAQRMMQTHTVRRVDLPTYIYHRETPDSMCNVMLAQQGHLQCE